SRKTP
ncbi:efflux transporter, RND family, MFP subunit, partial [Vibrio parahaemolyticus V-223/04]